MAICETNSGASSRRFHFYATARRASFSLVHSKNAMLPDKGFTGVGSITAAKALVNGAVVPLAHASARRDIARHNKVLQG
jgi:hypothetical protein